MEAAAIAFEQAQQVMLAQMDVAHDVIMPVTAPMHMTLGSRLYVKSCTYYLCLYPIAQSCTQVHNAVQCDCQG